jgi:hypothetical protein
MPSLVTFTLTQLECKKESDAGGGGSEPYLWVTYFALDARNIARPEPVTTITPAFDSFRAEFPQSVKAGQVMPIRDGGNLTPFSLEVDLDSGFNMAGCIAVLLEEDETPNAAMVNGRIAYAGEVHKQLNILVKERIRVNDRGAITTDEIKVIKKAVKDKVLSAVAKKISINQVFHNRDDQLGFTYVNLINDEITSKPLRFPEIFEGDDIKSSSNRYVLSGRVTVGPIPPVVVELCPKQRAAVKAKEEQIKSLLLRKMSLQQQLQTASTGAKAGIVAQITATNLEKTRAESDLPPLVAALAACMPNVPPIDPGGGGVVVAK